MRNYLLPVTVAIALAGASNPKSAFAYDKHYWHGNSGGTWTSGNGTTWDGNSCGSGTLEAWPAPWDTSQSSANTVSCDAHFCNSGTYTVTLSNGGSGGEIEVSGLFFDTGTVTLAGSSGLYYCGGAPTYSGGLIVANGLTAYLNTSIGGAVDVYYNVGGQTGTLVIGVDNSGPNHGGGKGALTHWWRHYSGTIQIASPGAFGTNGFAFYGSSATSCYIQAVNGAQSIGCPFWMFANGSINTTYPLTLAGAVHYYLGTGYTGGGTGNMTLNLINPADVLVTGAVQNDSGSGSSGGVNLTGFGRIVLSNTGNANTGNTSVNGPTVKAANASGNAAGSGTILLSGYGILTGTGSVGAANVNSGGTIAPGDWPNLGAGTLTAGALTLAGGGHYFCAVTGTGSTACSLVNCGALTITAASTNQLVVDVTAFNGVNLGLPAGFNPASPYSWTILSASSISGFAANAFAFTSSALPATAFSVSQSGNTLVLNYTPPAVPGVVATLFNTGLNASGGLLAPGGVDAHWNLTTSPDGTYTGPNLVAVTNNSATWNLWKSAPYSWDISPRGDAGNVAPGDYVYSTSFDLTGFNPRQVVISGRFTADDGVTSFKINGVETGVTNNSFTLWKSFSIPDGLLYQGTNRIVFAAGSNSVQIVVHNAGSSANPSGFNMQWSAWQVPIVPPTFISQTVNGFPFPSSGNIDVTPNSTATFIATTTATDPMNYQWSKNGVALTDGMAADGAVITGSSGTLSAPGQSTVTMTIANFQLNESGTYSCLFSNLDGLTNTPGVLVQPATAPVILTNPVSMVVGLGTNSSFSVLAAGPSLAYRWSHNSTPLTDAAGHISGSGTAVLNITGSQDADAGTYVCTITNSYGATNTPATATLTVIDPPVVTLQPTNQLNVMMTSNAAFSVVATGGSSSYQWYRNGTPIANGHNVTGATSPTLSISPVMWDAASYTVIVSNFAGKVTSSSAVLTVNTNFLYESFEIYSQGDLETNGTVNTTFANAWFGPNPPNCHVDAAQNNVNPQLGSQMVGPDTYNAANNDQNWLNLAFRMGGGNNLMGNFAAEWWFYDPAGTGTSAANYNDYNALCEYGSVPLTSDFGTVANIGSIGYVSGGQRMSLGAYTSQAGLVTTYYQARIVGAADGVTTTGWFNLTGITRSVGWHHARIVVGVPNGANTTASFFIDDMSVPLLTDAITTTTGFNLFELGSGYGTTTGWYDDLVVRQAGAPWIIEQPASVTVQPGNPGTFNIVANGSSYQWYENGTAMSGQNSPSLSATDVATYTCVVTGAGGSVTSAPVVLSTDASIGTGTGLLGLYSQGDDISTYSNIDLSTPICTDVVDSQVYLNGNGAATIPPSCPSLTGTDFNVRWTGLIQPPYSDTYTFYAIADDGVRVWVNNQLVIDHWVLQAPTEWWSAGIPLQGGQLYAIQMEYFQHQGGDYYSLSWASDHLAKQLITQGALFPFGMAPNITVEPSDQYPNAGDTATFSVTAVGEQPLSYQWYLNNTNGVNQAIPGATSATLSWPNVQVADGLNYYFVVVSNSYGTTNSTIGHMFVSGASTVVVVPHSQSVTNGGTATFTFRASGLPYYGADPWYYVVDWYFNDNDLNSPTTALTVANAQPANAGKYSIEVQGDGWDTTSDYAYLTVTNPPAVVPHAGPARFMAVRLLTNQSIQMTATGTVNAVYYIDAMTNLVSPHWMGVTNWTQRAILTNTTGTFQYTEPATNKAGRYYRARGGS